MNLNWSDLVVIADALSLYANGKAHQALRERADTLKTTFLDLSAEAWRNHATLEIITEEESDACLHTSMENE